MAILSLLASLSQPAIVSANAYDDTNPAATTCGNGSHTVTTWRKFYIMLPYGPEGDLYPYAMLELRRSSYCDTVWTRVTNLTGSGSGYPPARSLTTDERMSVYSCPDTSCQTDTETEFGDVLPNTGSTGWSHQFGIPASSSLGSPAAKQPPTIAGKVWVHTNGTTYSFDTNLEPLFTWSGNQFRNERQYRVDSRVMSCDNSSTYRCAWWGEPGGSAKTVKYFLDQTLNNTFGTADVVSDLQTALLPAWDNLATRSPNITSCTSCSGYQMTVKAVIGAQMGGYAGSTGVSDNGATPAVFTTGEIKLNIDISWSHPCGAADDGCSSPGGDDRITLSHEIGHSLGLGHCDLDRGVMCHAAAHLSWSNGILVQDEGGEGTSYWTPKGRDILGIEVIYP